MKWSAHGQYGSYMVEELFPKVVDKFGVPITNDDFGKTMESINIFHIAISNLTSLRFWWNSNEMEIFS